MDLSYSGFLFSFKIKQFVFFFNCGLVWFLISFHTKVESLMLLWYSGSTENLRTWLSKRIQFYDLLTVVNLVFREFHSWGFMVLLALNGSVWKLKLKVH